MSFESTDAISFFLFALIFYFLSVLSKRLGEVLGMKRYYYLYYSGMALMLFASAIMTTMIGVEDTLLWGYVFFSIGLTLGLFASIKYWGWLLRELIKG